MDDSRLDQPESIQSAPAAGLANWTPEQIAQGKAWVRAWDAAGAAMEELRRQELRQLDGYRAIELLCGPADYRVPPRAPQPTSGLVEQQRWFMKAAAMTRGTRDAALPTSEVSGE